jgi:hypothetical protein
VELNDLYSSPNIIWVIKSRRVRWVGYVAPRGHRRFFWWGNLRERDYLEGPGVDGRKILKWILRKSDGEAGTAMMWLRLRTGNSSEGSNEPSGSIKRGELLDWLITG